MSGEHARLSPSGAAKWTACAGVVYAEKGITNPDNSASMQGTAAHELLELALTREIESVLDESGRLMSNGVVLTDDDVAAVKVAEDYILSREFTQMYSEMKVPIGAQMGRTDIWGTADVIGVEGGLLEVIDYKHGKGIVVDVKANLQLLLYAIGAVAIPQLQDERAETTFTTVRMTIIQPRADHEDGVVRSWDISREALEEWVAWFKHRAEMTDDPKAERTPGDTQCRWCLAKGVCAPLAEYSMTQAMALFDNVDMSVEESSLLKDPKALTPDQTRSILDNTKLISAWLTAVNTHALQAAVAGGKVLGYKIVAGRRAKSYIMEDDDIEKALRKLSKINGSRLTKADVTVTKLLSPAKAVALLKPLLSPEAFQTVGELIKVGDGSPTLVPVTDRRAALPSQVDAAFAGIDTPDETEDKLAHFLS